MIPRFLKGIVRFSTVVKRRLSSLAISPGRAERSSMEQDNARKSFYARLDDLIDFSERGRASVSPFLTPAERRIASDYLQRRGMADLNFFWGGHAFAERVCLWVLPDAFPLSALSSPPDRLPDWFDPAFDSFDAAPVVLFPDDGFGIPVDKVACVVVTGSGFRVLTHRDYLGSLLASGLERDCIGDIVPLSPSSAAVFCRADLVPFLCSESFRVGSDAVKVAPWSPPLDFAPSRTFLPVSDTVASARLDCVVAALANLSRDAAQSHIRSGFVEVDFAAELRPDRLLSPPQILSIRSVGRFRLLSFSPTRKSRLRLEAKKYL